MRLFRRHAVPWAAAAQLSWGIDGPLSDHPSNVMRHIPPSYESYLFIHLAVPLHIWCTAFLLAWDIEGEVPKQSLWFYCLQTISPRHSRAVPCLRHEAFLFWWTTFLFRKPHRRRFFIAIFVILLSTPKRSPHGHHIRPDQNAHHTPPSR